MINITEEAKTKILELKTKENRPEAMVRLILKGFG